ncbi:MAG: Eco47II family restriction endonuclease [Caldisericia bacterium]|nr:Eco47II family restriction endonuclease [Caldisericia bacterium]
MSKLSYISDLVLYKIVSDFIKQYNKIQSEAENKLEENALDPFSAILYSMCSGSNLSQWFEMELERQIGKSFQNNIGEFHQSILGSCCDWEIIDDVIDIRNQKKRIIAEIKNKYNTTKGSDKKVIYDNLVATLESDFYKNKNYTAYYVEIIPKNNGKYNNPFTPTDSTTKTRKPKREDVRIIDGVSFYALATGEETALHQLYKALPLVVQEIKGSGAEIIEDPLFDELFIKTF